MPKPIDLSEDERECVHRSLSLRRDALRSELLFYHERPDQSPQVVEAARIIAVELELIARCIRAMWVGKGGTNGNYNDKEPPP